MNKETGVSVVLVIVLAGILILFGVIAFKQYDLAWQIYLDSRDEEDVGEKFTAIMSNFDKTLTTLVGFITAVATGILGYFGGASGKKEAQEEASQAKGALNEIATQTDPNQAAFLDSIRNKYPKAFGVK